MLNLPRGAFKGHENVALSTAEWGRPQEVARFAYTGGGSLFLGSIPYEESWVMLLDMRPKFAELAQQIETGRLTPPEKAKALRQLEALWVAALGADNLPIGLEDDRHVVTIAGARSGKGLSAIIPNLCLYPGSVVVLDPKGENASLTAARRGPGNEWAAGMGQAVYVLDPFGVADVPDELRASLNPIALLDKESPLVVDDAALLAEGLVLPGGDGDEHWTETARNLVKGVLLHLVSIRERPTLFDLRRLLTNGDTEGFRQAKELVKAHKQAVREAKRAFEKYREDVDPDATFTEPPEPEGLMPETVRSPFAYLLWCMERNDAFDGVVAGTAETLLGTGENERGSILSTARRNTAFLDTLGPRYKATLSGEFRPFDPDHLKGAPEGVSVYLCLPAERMGTHGRWLRLMIGLFLEKMQRQLIEPASKAPVLFLLEEFFALGPMPSIEKAAGYAAGFGVKLWAILQDLQQLKSLYRTSWQTFLANAGAIQIFGASDRETLEYASKAMGEIEVSRVTASTTTNTSSGEARGSDLARFGPVMGGGVGRALPQLFMRGLLDDTSRSTNTVSGESLSVGLHVVPLLRPDEIALHFARESGAALLLVKGQRPMWCYRVNYNDSPWFEGLFTPLAKWQASHRKGGRPRDFWGRPGAPFRGIVEGFNALASAPA